MTRKRFLVAASLLAATLVAVCVILALVFIVQGYQSGMAREKNNALAGRVGERLRLGMTQLEVEQQIDGDAKKRYQCSWGVDVYLIGSADPNVAAILYLKYRADNDGTQILDRIAGLDQDMLFSYERCPASSP